MSNHKVVTVLLIVCGQDSLNDPKETVSEVDMEYDLPQIKVEGTNYAIDSFIHEESKRVRFGWHTRDKPFHPQDFRREVNRHRIRSRCF